MEINDLKSLWNELAKNQAESKIVAADEIKKLIKGKTHHAIGKINRGIMLEVGSLLLMTLFFSISIILYEHIAHKPLLSVVIIFCLASVLYYWIKYRRINQIINSGNNLRESLRILTKTLDYFLKFYLYSSLIVTPIAFVTGFFYGYFSLDDSQTPKNLSLSVIGILLILSVLLVIVIYPFMKWYIRRLYGRYLDELKTCLQELEVDSIS